MIDTLHTGNAPEAIGPYSQAKIINGVLYASGQIAINPATSEVEATTIEEQTEQAVSYTHLTLPTTSRV